MKTKVGNAGVEVARLNRFKAISLCLSNLSSECLCQYFSSLAGLKVAEKFVLVGGGGSLGYCVELQR